jgi:hypothetical protein
MWNFRPRLPRRRSRTTIGTRRQWCGRHLARGNGPKGFDPSTYRRLLAGRNRSRPTRCTLQASALSCQRGRGRGAVGRSRAGGAAGGAGGRRAVAGTDFTTVRGSTCRFRRRHRERCLLRALFGDAPTKYDELKRKAARNRCRRRRRDDHLNIDADYQIVRTSSRRMSWRSSRDGRAAEEHVAFGAHYDHVRYAEGEVVDGDNRTRRLGRRGA